MSAVSALMPASPGRYVGRFVQRIEAAAERGAKLTRQLLAYARKTRLEPKLVNLNTLIDGFGEMLKSTTGNQIELQVSLRRRLPFVRVDPTHLEMALLNILINARDAMPQGGKLVIETQNAELELTDAPLRDGDIRPKNSPLPF